MNRLILVFLMLISPAYAITPVQFGKLAETLDAIEFYCMADSCFVRAGYYFFDQNMPMLTCYKIPNQPINATPSWMSLKNYNPAFYLSNTAPTVVMTHDEKTWCSQ